MVKARKKLQKTHFITTIDAVLYIKKKNLNRVIDSEVTAITVWSSVCLAFEFL